MSITPLMSGTPGIRNSGLVASAVCDVHSNESYTDAQIDAANDDAIIVR